MSVGDRNGIANECHVAERFLAQLCRTGSLESERLSISGTGFGEMEDVKGQTAKNADETGKLSAETVALHLRYRQIGISAVAAAARYQGSAKNQAYAPAAVGGDRNDPAAA